MKTEGRKEGNRSGAKERKKGRNQKGRKEGD